MCHFVEVVIPRRQPQAGLVDLQAKETLFQLLTSPSLSMSTRKQTFVFIPVALRSRNTSTAGAFWDAKCPSASVRVQSF